MTDGRRSTCAGPARRLVRAPDGSLFDLDGHRLVTIADLAGDVRVGRRFVAREQETDAPCTQQVLLEVLRHAVVLPGRGAGGGGPGGVATLLGETLAHAFNVRSGETSLARRPGAPGGPEDQA